MRSTFSADERPSLLSARKVASMFRFPRNQSLVPLTITGSVRSPEKEFPSQSACSAVMQHSEPRGCGVLRQSERSTWHMHSVETSKIWVCGGVCPHNASLQQPHLVGSDNEVEPSQDATILRLLMSEPSSWMIRDRPCFDQNSPFHHSTIHHLPT